MLSLLIFLPGRGQPFTSELQGVTLEVEGLAKDGELLSPDDGTAVALMRLRGQSWEDRDTRLFCTLDRLPDHTVPEERPDEVRPVVWLHLCRITHDFETKKGQPEETHIDDFFLVLEEMPQKQGRYRRLGLANRGGVEPRGSPAAKRAFPEEILGQEERRRFWLV